MNEAVSPQTRLTSTLLERLSPRLRELDEGGYLREYRRGGRRYRTSLHMAVSEILEVVAVGTKENVKVPGTSLTADFKVNGTFVFVDRELGEPELRKLKGLGRR